LIAARSESETVVTDPPWRQYESVRSAATLPVAPNCVEVRRRNAGRLTLVDPALIPLCSLSAILFPYSDPKPPPNVSKSSSSGINGDAGPASICVHDLSIIQSLSVEVGSTPFPTIS
jgi:hypothetical protein